MSLTPDLQALAFFFDAIIYILLFLISSIVLMKFIDLISHRLGTFIRYLAFPGVVLHEVCHDIFCRLTGIHIIEHRIFLGKQEGVAGGVIVNEDKIQTFTSSLLVAFAPLLVLGLALFLLITFWQMLPIHQVLGLYFAFCFFIGLSPSRADVKLVMSVAKNRPRQTFLELGLLSIPLITGYFYLTYCWISNSSFSFWIFGCVILCGIIIAFLLWYGFKSTDTYKTKLNSPSFRRKNGVLTPLMRFDDFKGSSTKFLQKLQKSGVLALIDKKELDRLASILTMDNGDGM